MPKLNLFNAKATRNFKSIPCQCNRRVHPEYDVSAKFKQASFCVSRNHRELSDVWLRFKHCTKIFFLRNNINLKFNVRVRVTFCYKTNSSADYSKRLKSFQPFVFIDTNPQIPLFRSSVIATIKSI